MQLSSPLHILPLIPPPPPPPTLVFYIIYTLDPDKMAVEKSFYKIQQIWIDFDAIQFHLC